jgi:hypothetical protein
LLIRPLRAGAPLDITADGEGRLSWRTRARVTHRAMIVGRCGSSHFVSPQMDALVVAERRALRLGAFPSALATIVPAAVAAPARAGADLELAAEDGTLAELVQAVQAGRLHAAVCFQDAATPRRDLAATLRWTNCGYRVTCQRFQARLSHKQVSRGAARRLR